MVSSSAFRISPMSIHFQFGKRLIELFKLLLAQIDIGRVQVFNDAVPVFASRNGNDAVCRLQHSGKCDLRVGAVFLSGKVCDQINDRLIAQAVFFAGLRHPVAYIVNFSYCVLGVILTESRPLAIGEKATSPMRCSSQYGMTVF